MVEGSGQREAEEKQRARNVLWTLLVVIFVAGLSEERTPGPWLLFVSTVLFAVLQNFLPFYWYRLDSDLRAYRRSRWMNAGIVFLAPVAIPVYLLRSRERGRRLRALLCCLGYAFLLMLAAGLGMFAGTITQAA
ncbi:hypothetical protein ACHAC9_02960 [Massilia sp. CMS3.1]|uniref:hypothetical protein n=1 Tax=Massilia sp. CMS3.1 TaxID=3373083 RepID=UPI003EE50E1E